MSKKSNQNKLILIFSVIVLVFVISGCVKEEIKKEIKTTSDPVSVVEETTPTSEDINIKNETGENNNDNQNKQKNYLVVNVVDGDTIDVEIDGQKERIRLIGVDTPETVDPRKPVQCFGKEASNKTKEVLNNKNVYLESDVLSGERDKYNRLLRYVFLEDGTNFNKLIISEGFAHEYTYNSIPYKYQSKFKQAEKEAQENKRGLWADGICEDKNNDDTESIIEIIEPSQNNSLDCDCSGNFYNCSDFKSHADAQDLFECCGSVGNDIHRLDRDGDGLACETLP